MCDLKRPGAAPPRSSNGLAFEIADHILITGWAELHGLRTTVRLDHGAAVGDDFEEVVAFQATDSPLYRSILWRNATNVFVQPIVGKATKYRSVADALDSLSPVVPPRPASCGKPGFVLAGSPRLMKSMALATTLFLILAMLA